MGELSLDLPAPPVDAGPGPVDRPWWASPVAIVLAILLCGPFGLAVMWVRGDYSKRARVTATVVWAGLTVLMLAAAALTLQTYVASILADSGRLGTLPGAPAGVATPLVFPTPATAPSAGAPQVGASPKPAIALSPPAIASSPGAVGARPSPGTVISPPQATPIPAPGSAPAPAAEGERVRIKDTGGSGANMRDKPGAIGNVVKTVPDGAALRVVGPDQDADGRSWRHVRDEGGDEGWIASDLVETAP
jgi:SH3 domain-containing protein